ncbi:Gfo/Idh/MocA family protein [Maribacter sp. 2307ULW6-5]|uniref:Gfo/Idh/MocA family protein n=1 Tax=Maribacter sp. 2307ULW6-5 TaxID=3386275 RepID=UPI0039BCB6F9
MTHKTPHNQRRHFIKVASAAALLSSLPSYGLPFFKHRAPLRVGLIGAGWYGSSDLYRLLQVANVTVTALCDVDGNHLKQTAQMVLERQPNAKRPTLYRDFRDMLKKHSLDIVLIGTPDHWHALQCLEALKAGAHVYLQKPISVDVLEGEALLAAAKKYDRVVQVGMQRRSTPHLKALKEQVIDRNLLGKVAHVEMCCYYHMRANANPTPGPIPDFLDYDLWTGPAPWRPYDRIPHRGWWRAFMEYSNGIVGDMCVHMLDTVRWMLDLGWPQSVSSHGGIYVQKESKANTPDTQTAVFQYPDLNCVWQHRSWGTPTDPEYPWAFFIYGEKGTVKGSVMKAEFIPKDPKKEAMEFTVAYEREAFPEDVNEEGIELHVAPATRAHLLDFLTAIDRGSRPVAAMEEGHISTASCILANMAMKLKRPLRYDPITHTVKNDREATELLARPYRAPWKHPYSRD